MSKKKKYFARLISVFLILMCLISSLSGCSVYTSSETELSYEEATEELSSLLSKVDTDTNTDPILDIYSDDTSNINALSDISAFPVTVQGKGDINLEIAGATEMTSESSPDDWLNVVAERFNKSDYTVESVFYWRNQKSDSKRQYINLRCSTCWHGYAVKIERNSG